jgi:hypothetical protein
MRIMKIGMLLSAAIIVGTASGAVAQTAEPSYKGDPSVYKVIFEDANFRVIEGIRKAGVHDKVHGHPLPSLFAGRRADIPRTSQCVDRAMAIWDSMLTRLP